MKKTKLRKKLSEVPPMSKKCVLCCKKSLNTVSLHGFSIE